MVLLKRLKGQINQDGSHSPLSSCLHRCHPISGYLSATVCVNEGKGQCWVLPAWLCCSGGCRACVVTLRSSSLAWFCTELWDTCVGPNLPPQILICPRERSCLGSCIGLTPCFLLSEESPAKIRWLRSSNGFFVPFLFSRNKRKKKHWRGYTKTSMVKKNKSGLARGHWGEKRSEF